MSAADVSLGSARRGRTLSLGRVLWWLALLTVIAGVGRIVATYDVLGITFDEPAHIAAGMQLLDGDKFTYEPMHPPLARIAVALGPYLAGYRAHHGGDMWIEGRRLFYGATGGPGHRLLTLARLGIVPFFVLTLALVWLWAARQFGAATGALAVILLGNLPLLLGHAALATTDVVFSAMFLLAFCAFVEWLRSEEHTSELQSHVNLVCRLLLEKKNEVSSSQPGEKRHLDSLCGSPARPPAGRPSALGHGRPGAGQPHLEGGALARRARLRHLAA